jgi:hypothetical protein
MWPSTPVMKDIMLVPVVIAPATPMMSLMSLVVVMKNAIKSMFGVYIHSTVVMTAQLT